MENRIASNHQQACRAVAALFRPRWLRNYAAGKLRSDPIFPAAFDLLGETAQPLLDVGCGIGLLPLYLHARGFRAEIVGLDIDAGKVHHARSAAALAGFDDLRFLEQDAVALPPDFCGNVALFDALHYLQPAAQKRLLTQLAARVEPGGMLLLRDCPRDGSLRYWMTFAGEIFAQTISWNIAGPLHFPTRISITTAFGDDQFLSEEQPMFGRGPFNNRLFIFRRKALVRRATVPVAE